ncbi:hypothetical protein WN48_03136 [Eufriesea mexicana]|nr:hypothetical protein WN48_03136 [Eufriesea mexicana]
MDLIRNKIVQKPFSTSSTSTTHVGSVIIDKNVTLTWMDANSATDMETSPFATSISIKFKQYKEFIIKAKGNPEIVQLAQAYTDNLSSLTKTLHETYPNFRIFRIIKKFKLHGSCTEETDNENEFFSSQTEAALLELQMNLQLQRGTAKAVTKSQFSTHTELTELTVLAVEIFSWTLRQYKISMGMPSARSQPYNLTMPQP